MHTEEEEEVEVEQEKAIVGGRAVSLSSIAYPPPLVYVPSPTRLLISRGKVWGNAIRTGGGGMCTCLQGNKGMVDWQSLHPTSAAFC